MLIRPGRSSGNLIDRRGGGGGGLRVGGGLGLGGLLLVLVLQMCTGIDFTQLVADGGGTSVAVDEQAVSEPSDQVAATLDAILVETEEVWGELYRESGETYPEPNLVLFSQATRTACGVGQAAMGPFYCPADRTIYLDASFFRQLERMGARGEFAVAYVVAHEVAHHVQNVEGLLGGGSRSAAASRQTELQADCLAGIWTHHAADEDGRLVLNESDIESGISAAAAVGDDAIQRRAGQEVRQETFTHGSSRERVNAFLSGYRSGDYAVCFS